MTLTRNTGTTDIGVGTDTDFIGACTAGLRNIQRHMTINVHSSSRKVPVIRQIVVTRREFYLQIFRKTLKYRIL
jgi:succinate dehydrogenase/fumarate reductase-like Fe-S protein